MPHGCSPEEAILVVSPARSPCHSHLRSQCRLTYSHWFTSRAALVSIYHLSPAYQFQVGSCMYIEFVLCYCMYLQNRGVPLQSCREDLLFLRVTSNWVVCVWEVLDESCFLTCGESECRMCSDILQRGSRTPTSRIWLSHTNVQPVCPRCNIYNGALKATSKQYGSRRVYLWYQKRATGPFQPFLVPHKERNPWQFWPCGDNFLVLINRQMLGF